MRDAYWELRKRGGKGPGGAPVKPVQVVLGRKYCSACGRWRHVCDFRPEKNNVSTGLDSYCRTCRRRKNRQHRAGRTPGQRELYREYQRIWCEVKRREASIEPRKFRKQSVIDRPERILLPPGPVLEMIGQYLETGGTILALADASGVSYKTIQRLLTGESRHVRLDAADKLAVAFGLHLDLLYDEEAA